MGCSFHSSVSFESVCMKTGSKGGIIGHHRRRRIIDEQTTEKANLK